MEYLLEKEYPKPRVAKNVLLASRYVKGRVFLGDHGSCGAGNPDSVAARANPSTTIVVILTLSSESPSASRHGYNGITTRTGFPLEETPPPWLQSS